MRLFLIRHGETEHNVAGLLAGVTDSQMTNHGVSQTQKLGEHLVGKRQLVFDQVFSSDLKRAVRTAQAICDVQNKRDSNLASIYPIQLPLIREQDFGSFELVKWARDDEARAKGPQATDIDFKPKETKEGMAKRASMFLDDHVLLLLALDEGDSNIVGINVAVVSHGLFLGALWRALISRFKPGSIVMNPDAAAVTGGRPLEHLPSWNNTGIVEVEIMRRISNDDEPDTTQAFQTVPSKLDATMKIIKINDTDHLRNLKRARGGIGSSAADDKQRRLDGFFKKPKPS